MLRNQNSNWHILYCINTVHMLVVKLAHVSKVWLSSHMTINYRSKKDSGYSMQADELVERLDSETDLSA